METPGGNGLSLTTRRFVLAALLGLATVSGASIARLDTAFADQFVALGAGWQTYINDRFGVRFDYPSNVFTPDPPPENGDGRTFRSADAALYIFAGHNVLNETPASTKARLIGSLGYEAVTYSPSGRTWLVLSGYRGDAIFYEKYFFTNGVVSAFMMEFPAAQKPYYSPIIERIEDSFRAGGSN